MIAYLYRYFYAPLHIFIHWYILITVNIVEKVENNMRRLIENSLMAWKQQSDKKPLIIKGARQVGKTTTIREFAKQNYENLIEINFEKDLNYIKLFQRTHNPKDILEYLQIEYMNIPFNKQTLFFMDEIQACPDAITTLKFMKENFPCDIICSSSMLGVAIAKTTSYPVGMLKHGICIQ